MAGYATDTTWRKTQRFLPKSNRLTRDTLPQEYFLPLPGAKIHIDHYRVVKPKARIILFHGVGGNGRLLSFIAVPLQKNGFEVICPDLPLYGCTVYSGAVTYEAWVACGSAIVKHYQKNNAVKTFLFGLSAGGMLAYQIAAKCGQVGGVMATCLLDQRDAEVTRQTAVHPLVAAVGKPVIKATHKIVGGLRLPMKLVANMKAIANNKHLAALLMKDRKSSGVLLPLTFIHSLITPTIQTEPQHFTTCPFLLAHPGDDRWTDIALSRRFFDRLACEKEITVLEGAGHFPVEAQGLRQLEQACTRFLHKHYG